jgi:hypothetical protein
MLLGLVQRYRGHTVRTFSMFTRRSLQIALCVSTAFLSSCTTKDACTGADLELASQTISISTAFDLAVFGIAQPSDWYMHVRNAVSSKRDNTQATSGYSRSRGYKRNKRSVLDVHRSIIERDTNEPPTHFTQSASRPFQQKTCL